jgi:hypothetical protein
MTVTWIIIAVVAILIIFAWIQSTSGMLIERNVMVNKPLNEVFNYLKLVRNQDNFSVWNMEDPTKKTDFVGTDGTVGYVYKWDSPTNKNVGAGEQQILAIEEGKTILYEVRFFRPMKNVAQVSFSTREISANQTQVEWEFNGKSVFPFSLLKSVFANMLGKDMQKSLDNLKGILEK